MNKPEILRPETIWDKKTPQEILRDINAMLVKMHNDDQPKTIDAQLPRLTDGKG